MSYYGKGTVIPRSLKVNQRSTWQLRYSVGAKGVDVGGRIKVQILGRGFCNPLQIARPEEAEFVTVASCSTRSTVRLLATTLRNGTMMKEVGCVVDDAPLKEREEVIFTFGDTSRGSPGFTVPKYSQILRIQVLIDVAGNRSFFRVPDPCNLVYKPEDPARFVLVCSSQAQVAHTTEITVKAMDQYNNLYPSYKGRVDLKLCSRNGQILKEFSLEKKDEGISKLRVKAPSPGTYFFVAEDKTAGIKGSSNPVVVENKIPLLRYFWGEIHGHTLMSDGHLTPHQSYTYARDIQMLDFSAITDHDTHMTRREKGGEDAYLLSPFWRTSLDPWNVIKYETDRFHQPGRFVTFLGYEWTGSTSFTPRDMCFGHKNVYYLSDDESMYSHLDPESNTSNKLYDLLRNKEAIVIPHHTSRPVAPPEEGEIPPPTKDKKSEPSFVPSRGGTNWDFHDEKLEPLVEIYSKWGNSEYFNCPRPVVNSRPEGCVEEALKRGYKMGFVAGSDTHVSGPGSPFPEWEGGPLQYRSGLTCVLAKDLTRQEIFEALKRRHCYATTGERIYLEFRLNDEFIMGDEAHLSSAKVPRKFKILVAGTTPLDKVQVIKNNQEVHLEKGESRFLEFEFEDDEPIRETDYYYLRVIQKDGEMAWSSPMWVNVS